MTDTSNRHLLVGTLWRHVKTDTVYRLMSYGRIEATLEEVVIYDAYGEETTHWWVRPAVEFFDGRFVRIGG